jgi:histidine triad (HIT) family protein
VSASDSGGGESPRAAGSPRRDPSCLFCKIVAGEIPSTGVAEDETVVAIRDISPRAPTHILVMPRDHIRSAAELTDADADLVGRILAMAADIARSEGIADSGYRIVTNVGAWGGQTVDHLHFHLMGGRAFSWPPG